VGIGVSAINKSKRQNRSHKELLILYNYHIMDKAKHKTSHKKHASTLIPMWLIIPFLCELCIVILVACTIAAFENKYEGKIYPKVTMLGISFGGKTKQEVSEYWEKQNKPFSTTQFELTHENNIATISGSDIQLGYDATLSAAQAYAIGRSGNWASDIYNQLNSVELTPRFHWDSSPIDEALNDLAERIDIPVENALFKFSGGKVTAFKPSRDGRKLNIEKTKQQLDRAFLLITKTREQKIIVNLTVDPVYPSTTTDRANAYGIKELIGRGYSEFSGSISGRIHNVALAASRLNGILIKPGETFSFNKALGDISAATGYQSAYIIKEGRTVLGDGGGVCQVSSTLFRAALEAGLPIVERHAHAYRVHYYEEGGFKPGLDATVFDPSADFKFTNDTPTYILIQAYPDTRNLTLTFELYGAKDGRTSEIFNHKVWDITPPPPPLYQDDPTLPKGVVKQVDWEAWGTKASFAYRVTRDGKVLQDTTFYSNFRPWQAVYLRGPQ
jgi:vancomycin resistance protein YoaR